MSTQSRILSEEVLANIERHDRPAVELLEMKISYNLGGINYLNYKNDARGYYLYSTVLIKGDTGSGFTFREFSLFSGFKKFIQPATRFSAKTLASIVVDPALIAELRAATLAQREETNARKAADRARSGVA